MGLVDDILQGLPVNSILREKVSQLNTEKASVDEQNAILKDDLREAKMLIEELKEQVKALRHQDDLDELEVKLLHRIANLDYDVAVPEVFAQGFDVSSARFKYHLQRLLDLNYVRSGIIDSRGVHYEATQNGRTLLLKRNLL